jgi:hypothetical protein
MAAITIILVMWRNSMHAMDETGEYARDETEEYGRDGRKAAKSMAMQDAHIGQELLWRK